MLVRADEQSSHSLWQRQKSLALFCGDKHGLCRLASVRSVVTLRGVERASCISAAQRAGVSAMYGLLGAGPAAL